MFPEISWVRDLEYYIFPLLSEYVTKNGTVYLCKWCDVLPDGLNRYLLTRANKKVIDRYLNGQITMYELLTKPSGNVGFLVDVDNKQEVKNAQIAQVTYLNKQYLPDQNIIHDSTLRHIK